MHEPQKLHPLAYLSSAFSFVKNMFVPIFLVALNTNFSNLNFIELVRSISTVAMLVLSIVVILIIVSALVEMLNIYRTRFWIEDNKFHYHDGVFVKREKELNIRRIDSVDISEPVYLRIFGASRLKVTTPGEGLTISVMKKTQASELQETLYYEKEKLEAIDEGQTESTDVIDEELDETEEVSSAGASKSEPKERELLYAMT